MKRASNRGYLPKSRQWSGVSARRGAAERERQEQLQREFGIGWYEAYKMQRREAAEAKEGGRDGKGE